MLVERGRSSRVFGRFSCASAYDIRGRGSGRDEAAAALSMIEHSRGVKNDVITLEAIRIFCSCFENTLLYSVRCLAILSHAAA